MATHPDQGLPADQIWRTGVTDAPPATLDPVRDVKFTISPLDAVASAGPCFAQHIAAHLRDTGYTYLQTEAPGEPGHSARFGRIRTPRQLHQLLLCAYGLHRPQIRVWRRPDGRFIDPLRPQILPAGFKTADDAVQDRRAHLAAIRRMFEECRVFIYTLATTEAWLAEDGTVLPVAPGAIGIDLPGKGASFVNFTAADMAQDVAKFLADLTAVNPDARVILTVSPVPQAATHDNQHALTANTYSKAALRVVAGEAARANPGVAYFPAYEIATAPHHHGAYVGPDLRHVTAAGTAHMLRVFTTHYLTGAPADAQAAAQSGIAP